MSVHEKQGEWGKNNDTYTFRLKATVHSFYNWFWLELHF